MVYTGTNHGKTLQQASDIARHLRTQIETLGVTDVHIHVHSIELLDLQRELNKLREENSTLRQAYDIARKERDRLRGIEFATRKAGKTASLADLYKVSVTLGKESYDRTLASHFENQWSPEAPKVLYKSVTEMARSIAKDGFHDPGLTTFTAPINGYFSVNGGEPFHLKAGEHYLMRAGDSITSQYMSERTRAVDTTPGGMNFIDYGKLEKRMIGAFIDEKLPQSLTATEVLERQRAWRELEIKGKT